MKKLFLFALLTTQTFVIAQNLVQNHSFENITACPIGPSELANATPWQQATTGGTSDLFNVCNQSPFPFPTPIPFPGFAAPVGVPANLLGFQQPRTGDSYAGFYALEGLSTASVNDYREYVQAPLSQALSAGNVYNVKFYVSLCNTATIASDGIGAYFSTGPVSSAGSSVLSFIPQVAASQIISDTSGWVLVEGSFVATEAYTHITIGNFKDNASTTMQPFTGESFGGANGLGVGIGGSYYYIDDVSVEPGGDVYILGESQVCQGQTVTLTAYGANSYTWSPEDGVSCVNCNEVTVSPDTTTTYIVVGDNGETFYHTVYVNPQNVATISASQNLLIASSGGVSYQWYYNNEPIAGATGITYMITKSGLYYCIITYPNGCTSVSNGLELTYQGGTGLEELGLGIIQIFPNPADDFAIIQFEKHTNEPIHVQLVSLNGELVFETMIATSTLTNKIDVSSLSSGTYFIKLQNSKGIYFHKISK